MPAALSPHPPGGAPFLGEIYFLLSRRQRIWKVSLLHGSFLSNINSKELICH